MRFDLGDPPRRVDLVVECKRGEGHDRGQWEREWRARAETYPDEGIDTDVVLLAVGKWRRTPSAEVAAILSVCRKPMPERVRVVAMDWRDLTDTLARWMSKTVTVVSSRTSSTRSPCMAICTSTR